MNTKLVQCDLHGEQPETFVCQHIADALKNNPSCGFWWAEDSESDRPDAWCSECNLRVNAGNGQWTEEALNFAQV